MTNMGNRHRIPVYNNPILNGDWPDPDAVQVEGTYYLIASSFNRVPGLPVLRSKNLVDWEHAGHALPELPQTNHYSLVRHGSGVWAPALRHHDGKFWIFYPDPDHGIFVLSAEKAEGPWSEPHLLYPGRGLIDPCPLWDDDGTAYLVHGWAKSRIGVKNRLTVHRMSPDASRLLDHGTHVINGEELPGFTTLEGPKFYKRDGWYWIFAPAGGVATGWQSVFRSRSPFGPYEERRVLEQGDSPVNGPHQGAWVTTPEGEDWFLHFQDRGAYGRVVHLQPMGWGTDGWPWMGTPADDDGPGTPVLSHPYPVGTSPEDVAPAVQRQLHVPWPGPAVALAGQPPGRMAFHLWRRAPDSASAGQRSHQPPGTSQRPGPNPPRRTVHLHHHPGTGRCARGYPGRRRGFGTAIRLVGDGAHPNRLRPGKRHR